MHSLITASNSAGKNKRRIIIIIIVIIQSFFVELFFFIIYSIATQSAMPFSALEPCRYSPGESRRTS